MIHVVEDDALLADFFRADPFLHLYSLGDLDPFFRPHARWWGLWETEDAEPVLREAALYYDAGSLPVLLAFSRDPSRMCALLAGIRDRLPGRFYAHFSPEAEAALRDDFRLESHGPHLRMGLIDEAKLADIGGARGGGTDPADPGHASAPAESWAEAGAELVILSPGDLAEVSELFAASYPGNWFEPRMLETGQYVGARIEQRLAAVAGVHVYSPPYRVAALGNITTRPEHRGKGLARFVTGALCRRLRSEADWIGLNVHADNAAAIACYRGLGFARVADYEEFMVERRG